MANTVNAGFVDLQEVWDKRAKEIGVERISTAIQLTLDEYNRQLNALLAWVTPTVQKKLKVDLASGGTMQLVDEWGTPHLTRPAGQYEVGFPLFEYSNAVGGSRWAWPTMTVAEINTLVTDALQKDVIKQRQLLLATIFTNVNWTFDDPQMGNITITPLANGDSVTYVKEGGLVAAETDNHFLAQANAIDDINNPFPSMRDNFIEHPTNSEDIVIYVASNLRTSIQDLTDFVPVQDILVSYGANTNTLTDTALAEMEMVKGAGNEVLGRVDRMWIVEWRALPSSYMIAVAMNNESAIKRRINEVPELQGLRQIEVRGADHSVRWEWYHMYGFGIYDRTAMVVQRIGNGTYAIPTGYQMPIG